MIMIIIIIRMIMIDTSITIMNVLTSVIVIVPLIGVPSHSPTRHH